MVFDLIDAARRQAGRVFDATGLGAVESPFRIVAELPGARLRAYHPPGAGGPAILVLPAPFKRAYIWDLAPEVSVLRRCLERGLAVYLLEWTRPGPRDDDLGLADYADRLPADALDAVAGEAGRAPVVLAGHSLGGTFAAIFAALHPDRVRALALIDAPLAFGAHGGPLARALAAVPHARLLRRAAGTPVPGSAIDLLTVSAAPDAFQLQRWADLAASLGDPRALALHFRVERWMLDEFPLPGRLFEEVAERLYREDRFLRGTLDVGGRRTGIDRLRAPVLSVVNPPGRVVPPDSVLAALDAVPHLRTRVLTYEADRGPALQHLGPLVAPIAHRRLWPEILDWIAAQ